jgi:hypothetical protein
VSLQDEVLATTPQDVFNTLREHDESEEIWMDQACQCALHAYFLDVYPTLAYVAVHTEDVGIDDGGEDGEQYLRLPGWMNEFQVELMDQYPYECTVGDVLDYLRDEFHVEEGSR